MVMAVDSASCTLATWLALSLRLEEVIGLEDLVGPYLLPWLASMGLAWVVFAVNGLYRTIFRHAGFYALASIAAAMAIYTLVYAGIFTVIGVTGVPRSVGVSQPLLLLVMVAMSRALMRFWLADVGALGGASGKLKRVLVYGAGDAGRELSAALRQSSSHRLAGFVDDDTSLHGRRLEGVPVFDPVRINEVVKAESIDQVFLAIPSLDVATRNIILQRLAEARVHVKTLPSIAELADREGLGEQDLRELDLQELLGRAAVAPHPLLIERHTKDQVVLVTGAAGSIGSELVRQLLQHGAARVLLLDQSEFGLFSLAEALSATEEVREGRAAITTLLGSVLDAERLDSILCAWRPSAVYHAAAYKHVPLVEHNPVQGVFNNVFGTLTLVRACVRAGVPNLVVVSTDKAVRPTNVMGASKRLSEMILQALAEQNLAELLGPTDPVPAGRTRMSMVRFGNVLGSSGSVVPLFREQIAAGGPVRLTHRDVTRYFMTIPEAAQLVIQAGALADGGEVFVLDMGLPVRIESLARRMIALSGHSVKDAEHPDGDIEIAVTGLRPGEKLFEELLIGDDPRPTSHPRIMCAKEPWLAWPELSRRLDALELALHLQDVGAVKAILKATVPGYCPEDEHADWVYRAEVGALEGAG
jgi:FlaA1/EpsC-like NDP-sugar epimerase